MAAADDGSTRLVAQAAGPAQGSAPTRRVAFLRGERIVVVAAPGETIEIEALLEDIVVARVDGGILFSDGSGGEILLRQAGEGALAFTIAFLDGPVSIEDLLATISRSSRVCTVAHPAQFVRVAAPSRLPSPPR